MPMTKCLDVFLRSFLLNEDQYNLSGMPDII